MICFVFDPIVFNSYGSGKGAELGNYKPFAYILSFVSVMAMSAWLLWGKKLKWFNALLSGLFSVCALISLAIGIILLPLSLLGLVVIIGVLGFTPLFSSIAYSRNALRAYISAKPFLKKTVLIYSLILSALFSIVIPSVINSEINKKLNEMVESDVQTIRENAQILKLYRR